MLEGIFNRNFDDPVRSILWHLTNDDSINLARTCTHIWNLLATPAEGNAAANEATAVWNANNAAAATNPPVAAPAGPIPAPPVPVGPLPPPPGAPLPVFVFPAAVAGAFPPINPPEALRYQADLIDKCDEQALPIPPAVAGLGTCPNRHGTQHRVKNCQYARYPIDHGLNHTNPRQTVCTGCRDIWHFSRLDAQTNETQHSRWRQRLTTAHAPVCRLCETEQRNNHPEGLDACTCYSTLYEQRWLCHICSGLNFSAVVNGITPLYTRRRWLRMVNKRMVIQPAPLNAPPQNPLCACERAPIQVPIPRPDPIFHIPQPIFPGNHMIEIMGNPPILPRHVRRCLMCCGFIVRRNPNRRSLRVRDRRMGIMRKEEMVGDTEKARRSFTLGGLKRGWGA